MKVRELVTKLGFDVDNKTVDSYQKSVDSTIGMMKGFAVAGAAIFGAGGMMLKGAADMEQVEVAFETMTGSAETAGKLIEDITDFAASTPFELVGLIENSKKLLAFGFGADEIIDKMTNLGNIAAGIGTDKLPTLVSAFGKIRAKGKASMEELNMMLEAGVPILDELAKKYDGNTQTLFKMVTAGKISFEDVDKALASMANGNGKFADLMIKQSKTFSGLFSNIKDLITNLSNSIGKELLPMAKELASEFINFLTVNKEIIKQNMITLFKVAGGAVKFLWTMIKGLIDVLGGGAKAFKRLLILMAIMFGAKMIYNVLKMAKGITAIAKAQAIWNAIMLASPIILIALAIAAGIALIVLAVQDLMTYLDGGDSIIGDLIDGLKTFWNFLKKIFFDYHPLGILIDNWSGIVEFFENLWSKIVSIFDEYISIIADKIKFITDFFKSDEEVALDAKIKAYKDSQNQAAMSGLVSGSGKGTTNTNIELKSDIQVQVPAGTSQEQQTFLQNVAQNSFRTEFQKQLKALQQNVPIAEAN